MKGKLFAVKYSTYGFEEIRSYMFGDEKQIKEIHEGGQLDDVGVTGERYPPELIEIGEFTLEEAEQYVKDKGQKLLEIVYGDGKTELVIL